jgi:hypothetical protein
MTALLNAVNEVWFNNACQRVSTVYKESDRAFQQQARTSMVDGFPYKEEVGGSNPSVPTSFEISDFKSQISLEIEKQFAES